MDTVDLSLPDYYINRELSQIEFNARVLEQAKDERVALLERLKFLCIFSTNTDEFFEIRVSGLKQRIDISPLSTGPENLAPPKVLRAIASKMHRLVTEQYRILNEELFPALQDEGVRFLPKRIGPTANASGSRTTFTPKSSRC